MSKNEPPAQSGQHQQQQQQHQQQQQTHIKREALPLNPNLTPTGQLTHAQQLQAAIRQQQATAAARAALLASQGKNTALNRLGGDDEQPVAFTSFNDGEESDSEISNIDDFDNDGGISQLKNELVMEKETDSDVSMMMFPPVFAKPHVETNFKRIFGPAYLCDFRQKLSSFAVFQVHN